MKISDFENRSTFKVYPSFVYDSVIRDFYTPSSGVVKNNLVNIVKNNLNKAIKEIQSREYITNDELMRFRLYPIGVAEFWKSDKNGYQYANRYYGLFLNNEGIKTLEQSLENHLAPSDQLDMRKHFFIKEIDNSYGDLN